MTTPSIAQSPTLAQYLVRWLATVVEPNLEPATYAYYETMTRLYIVPMLGTKRLDHLQPDDVQAWLGKLAMAADGMLVSPISQSMLCLTPSPYQGDGRPSTIPGVLGCSTMSLAWTRSDLRFRVVGSGEVTRVIGDSSCRPMTQASVATVPLR